MMMGGPRGSGIAQNAINIVSRDPLYFEAILGGGNGREVVVSTSNALRLREEAVP
jgi:hypothetical protein